MAATLCILCSALFSFIQTNLNKAEAYDCCCLNNAEDSLRVYRHVQYLKNNVWVSPAHLGIRSNTPNDDWNEKIWDKLISSQQNICTILLLSDLLDRVMMQLLSKNSVERALGGHICRLPPGLEVQSNRWIGGSKLMKKDKWGVGVLTNIAYRY
jgi:hypothetical protein